MQQQFPPRFLLAQRTRAELLLFTHMQTYTKQPITVAAQIQTLKQRGLQFLDENKAQNILSTISYFRLANYWKPLEQDKLLHIFKPNCHFEDVVSLYSFDKDLRLLIFSGIQSVEIALRTKVIHYVSLKYGSFWFADKTVFDSQTIYNKCFESIKSELARTKEDFIKEHFCKYDNPPYPPAWKTLEVSSFGTLSKLYCNLADVKLKKAIASDFRLPQHLFLESWIKSLSVLCNCVAHHARVWNRKFPWKPQIPRRLPSDWLTTSSIACERIYAQLCCIEYLLNAIGKGDDFKKSLKTLLSRYPNVDPRAMGFPIGWEQEPLWR